MPADRNHPKQRFCRNKDCRKDITHITRFNALYCPDCRIKSDKTNRNLYWKENYQAIMQRRKARTNTSPVLPKSKILTCHHCHKNKTAREFAPMFNDKGRNILLCWECYDKAA